MKTKKTEKLRFIMGGVSPYSDNRGVAAIFAGTLCIMGKTFSEKKLCATVWNTFPFSGERYINRMPTTNFQIPRNIEVKNVGTEDPGFSETVDFLFAFGRLLYLLIALAFHRFLSRLHINFFLRNDVFTEILSTDFIVELNFGDIFTDVHYARRLLIFNTLRLMVVIFSGKPVYMFPQAIGPFRSPINRAIARNIINRSKIVAVRDKYSLKHVNNLGTKTKILLAPDTGFFSSVVCPNEALRVLEDEGLIRNQRKTLIGLVVSPYFINPVSLKKSSAVLNQFVKTLDRIVYELDATLVFVPHDTAYQSTSFDCRQLSLQIYKMLRNKNRAIVLRKEYFVEELWGVLGLCDINISMMTHPVIGSLKTSVPVAAITYSHKTAGILGSFGLEEYVFSLTDFISGNNGVDAVHKLFDHRAAISQDLIRNMLILKMSMDKFQRQLFDDVAHLGISSN